MMADILTSGFKGNTKDMTVALFASAHPKVTDVMNKSEIEKATLADMLLARAASIMLFDNTKTTIVDTLNSNIRSIAASATKAPATLIKQSEEVQSKFTSYDNMRKSLERQMMEYANNYKASMHKIIQSVLDGSLSKDEARSQLTALNGAAEHLKTKIESVYKELNTLQDSQTKTLEDFYKTIPGKNLADLQKLLKPEESTPRPE